MPPPPGPGRCRAGRRARRSAARSGAAGTGEARRAAAGPAGRRRPAPPPPAAHRRARRRAAGRERRRSSRGRASATAHDAGASSSSADRGRRDDRARAASRRARRRRATAATPPAATSTRRQPARASAGVVARARPRSAITPASDRSRRRGSARRAAPSSDADAGADQHRGERREQRRRSTGGRCPRRRLKATAVISERAADGDQPAGAGVVAAQPRDDEQRRCRATEREAQQPAGLAAERLVEQPQRAGVAAEHAAAAATGRRPGPGAAAGPAVLAEQRGRGRCSRRSATRCCCRSCPRSTAGRRAGVSHISSGQASPTDGHRRAARGQLPDARRGGPRGATHSHAARDAGHDQQRRGHLRLEAEADAHAGQHEPARAPVLAARARAHHTPPTQHSTSSASGLLWREIATVDRRQREHQARRRTRPRGRSAAASRS